MSTPTVAIYDDPPSAARALAEELRQRAAVGPELVLGLPTGRTPIPLYREMVRLHQEAGADWSRLVCFNLDEYWPLAPEHPQSFARFMEEHLFAPGGIPRARTHIPDGLTPAPEIAAHAQAYEDAIRAAGGIALQLLGIGVNGHLGFNEPGTLAGSRTRMVELDPSTRLRATADFAPEPVPERGITMGLGTILEAREIVVLAFGADKAAAVAAAVRGEPKPECPASLLQGHDAVRWLLDSAAAAELD